MTDELPPIRCITCNKILGNLWKDYEAMLEKGISIEEALNNLSLYRPCCRLRLRNPFKVVDRHTQTQADVDEMYENNFDALCVASNPNATTTGALSAITDTTDIIIIPEEDTDIDLPPLPTLPKTDETGKIIRSYRSW